MRRIALRKIVWILVVSVIMQSGAYIFPIKHSSPSTQNYVSYDSKCFQRCIQACSLEARVPQKVCYRICFMECLSDSQIILYEQECFQSCSKECFTNDKIMQKPCVLMCIFTCLKHPDNPHKQADPLSYLYPLFLHFHMHIFISIPW